MPTYFIKIKRMNTWKELSYWQTGEWQTVEENLDELVRSKHVVNPPRKHLFACMDACPLDQTKVAIMGQDPYPDHKLATGIAFSIPADGVSIPPTLNTIFDELESDLHIPRPTTGCLEGWTSRGVLLWNVVPSCTAGHSLSHDWVEYEPLTKEIIEVLNDRNVVFCFLGSRARAYASSVDDTRNVVIETSHPSPRGSLKAKTPFLGSRIFSRINEGLVKLKKDPIDWRI